MALLAVHEIESTFAQLPAETQLSVIERLVHCMRTGSGAALDSWETELPAMAADPEVQAELQRIEAEFSAAETDGLETA